MVRWPVLVEKEASAQVMCMPSHTNGSKAQASMRNNVPLQLSRSDTCISSHDLVTLMSTEFLHTLIIDVSSPPIHAIPGTRIFHFLEQCRSAWKNVASTIRFDSAIKDHPLFLDKVLSTALNDDVCSVEVSNMSSKTSTTESMPQSKPMHDKTQSYDIDEEKEAQAAVAMSSVLNVVVSDTGDNNGFASPNSISNIFQQFENQRQNASVYETHFDKHVEESLQRARFHAVESSVFRQRIGNTVVLLDEQGSNKGFAAFIAALLRKEGLCKAAVVLQGGILGFQQAYPTLVLSYPSPPLVDHLNMEFLESLAGLAKNNPVDHLRERQDQLVQAVWFGSTTPSDLPSPIVQNLLYLSSCFAATREHLKRFGITHVIRLGWGFPTYCDIHDETEYHEFPIADSPLVNIRSLFEETTRIIETARLNGDRVLVHCHAGVSRSSTIVLAYMIKYLKMPLNVAWNTAYKIRPIIRPNAGFAAALQNYEKEQLGVFKSSMSIFWMSDSYLYYIDYIEIMYRLAGLPCNSRNKTRSNQADTVEQLALLQLNEASTDQDNKLDTHRCVQRTNDGEISLNLTEE